MKNLLYLCFTFLLLTNVISAQTSEQTDTIPRMSNFTLHGDAATFFVVSSVSLNVEGKLFSSDSEKFHLYGRAGYAYLDIANLIFCNGKKSRVGLLGLTILTGKGDHHFEVSGGTFLGSFKNKDNGGALLGSCSENSGLKVRPLIDLGYRFQKPESGFIFRAKVGIYGLGIGLGYAF